MVIWNLVSILLIRVLEHNIFKKNAENTVINENKMEAPTLKCNFFVFSRNPALKKKDSRICVAFLQILSTNVH